LISEGATVAQQYPMWYEQAAVMLSEDKMTIKIVQNIISGAIVKQGRVINALRGDARPFYGV